MQHRRILKAIAISILTVSTAHAASVTVLMSYDDAWREAVKAAAGAGPLAVVSKESGVITTSSVPAGKDVCKCKAAGRKDMTVILSISVAALPIKDGEPPRTAISANATCSGTGHTMTEGLFGHRGEHQVSCESLGKLEDRIIYMVTPPPPKPPEPAPNADGSAVKP